MINQLGHGASNSRLKVIQSSTFIITKAPSSNFYLKRAVATNLNKGHFYFQETAILYLCANGSDDYKRRWALNARKEFNRYEDERSFFENIFRDEEKYYTSFFADVFSTARSYFISKLLTNPSLGNYQPKIFDEGNGSDLFEKLYKREQEHPLSHSYINLGCIKEKKTGLFKKGD